MKKISGAVDGPPGHNRKIPAIPVTPRKKTTRTPSEDGVAGVAAAR
jgi:hypothetical protein